MKKKYIEMYKLTSEKEEELWKEAIFVFDSCAILDFYYIPISKRQKIYKEFFKKLENRLWIPFHVQYEYLKNRHNVIQKPISEKYNPLKKNIKEIANLVKKDFSNKIESIKNNTKNDDSHPYLDQKYILDFENELKKFTDHVKFFEETSDEIIKKIEKDIRSVEDNDDVLDVIQNNFLVGRDYSFSEIIEITKEGKHRYDFMIPPGYGDFKGKNKKKGTQIFGDLIIWKQILEYSKQQKKANNIYY